MLPSLPPDSEPNSLQFLLWYVNIFSSEPHENLRKDIIIINDDNSDTADEDNKKELVIYVVFFFFPSFIFLLNNESHSVQIWKTVLFPMMFNETIIQRLRISCIIP